MNWIYIALLLHSNCLYSTHYSFTLVVVATDALGQTDGRVAPNMRQIIPLITCENPLTVIRGNVGEMSC